MKQSVNEEALQQLKENLTKEETKWLTIQARKRSG